MGILDTNYEENRFEVNEPSLTNTTDSGTGERRWNYYTNLFNQQIHPFYVGVQNQTNMNVPTLFDGEVSPFFDDNPNLALLFGVHVYNKKFGFTDMNLVTPMYNIPYLGDDEKNYGKYYDYNGILSGYVLNGIEGLVETTMEEKQVATYTINEDSINNDKTKRLIYTPDKDVKELTYGPHELLKTYFHVNTGGVVDGTRTVYQDEYVNSSEVKFYNKVTNESDGMPYYIEVSLDEVTFQSYTRGSLTGTDGRMFVTYLPVIMSRNNPTCDGDGVLHYVQNTDGTYSTVKTSSYQYVEVTQNTYNIKASDGYGEDAEVDLDNNSNIPTTISIVPIYNNGLVEYSILRIDKEQYNEYSSVDVFTGVATNSIIGEESFWSNINTESVVSSRTYKIHIQGNAGFSDYNISVPVTATTYSHPLSGEISIYSLKYQFKLNKNTYELIQKDKTYVYNHSTNRSTGYSTTNKGYKYRIIAGETEDRTTNYVYYEKKTSDGGATITLYRNNDGTATNKYVSDKPSKYNNCYYKLDTTNNKISKLILQQTVKPVEIVECADKTEYYTTLNCGASVKCAEGTSPENYVYFNGEVYVDGIKYSYDFSNGSLTIIDMATTLEYPQTTNSSIFKLLGGYSSNINNRIEPMDGTHTSTSGIIAVTYEIDPNNIMYKVLTGVNDIFIVTKINATDSSPIGYISYSPKICTEIPELYCVTKDDGTIDNERIFLTGKGGWPSLTNLYLQYYEFDVVLCSVNDDSSTVDIETVTIFNTQDMVEYDGKEGYMVRFDEKLSISSDNKITNLFKIIDCTGLNIARLSVHGSRN